MIEELSKQIEETCRFCNPPEKERILYETDNFYVMLSLGPIVEGYTLLLSKTHISCCANLPGNIQKEFDDLYFAIRNILQDAYGGVVSYEHGQAGSCLSLPGSKHCFHSHMHFVPISIQLNKEIAKELLPVNIENLQAFRNAYREAGLPYLYSHDETGQCIYFVNHPIARQYLRKIVAISVDNPESWDWVTHQNWDVINSGIIELKPLFENLAIINVEQ